MSEKLEVEGRIKLIMDVETFESGFSKRGFVVTIGDTYPQDVKFELFKDKTSLIENFKVGSAVKVSFNPLGNEYNGKYYVNLQAWKLEANGSPAQAAPPVKTSTVEGGQEEEDSLPF